MQEAGETVAAEPRTQTTQFGDLQRCPHDLPGKRSQDHPFSKRARDFTQHISKTPRFGMRHGDWPGRLTDVLLNAAQNHFGKVAVVDQVLNGIAGAGQRDDRGPADQGHEFSKHGAWFFSVNQPGTYDGPSEGMGNSFDFQFGASIK